MGMYNEVFKRCPKECGRRAMTQIKPQIVLGFGGFDLDRPERLAEDLDADQLRQLEESIKGEWFECSCGHRFQLCSEAELEERYAIAERLSNLRADEES